MDEKIIMHEVLHDFIYIGNGLLVTAKLVASSITIGLLLGSIIAVLRYNKILLPLVNSWVSIVRGTPVVLQLSIVYFSFPQLFNIQLTAMSAGILTFSLNSSAYIAEIFRAGISTIPKGQFEVAKALEISPYYMWKDLILPQVFRNTMPALINEIIALLKETAIIGMISIADISRTAQVLAAEKFTYFGPLLIAGFYYYFLVLIIEWVGRIIEKRINYA
jgi:polar amino acid transport system permease protein